MKIVLNNGTELAPVLVTGEQRYVQGQSRDTLTFVFPPEQSLDALDALFTATNCENIVIGDKGNEALHHGYTIRAELKREPITVTPAAGESEAVIENRVFVSMSQRTYIEDQVAELTEALNMLLEGAVE